MDLQIVSCSQGAVGLYWLHYLFVFQHLQPPDSKVLLTSSNYKANKKKKICICLQNRGKRQDKCDVFLQSKLGLDAQQSQMCQKKFAIGIRTVSLIYNKRLAVGPWCNLTVQAGVHAVEQKSHDAFHSKLESKLISILLSCGLCLFQRQACGICVGILGTNALQTVCLGLAMLYKIAAQPMQAKGSFWQQA